MTRPRLVVWGTGASTNPMGQQRYERELQAQLVSEADPELWKFRHVPVQGLRGQLPGARRVPARLVARAPYRLAAAIGAMTWRTRGLVHRFDTRLPPHPGREILTVHDMAALRFPDEGAHTRSFLRGVEQAATVIVPSRFAAEEVATFTGRQDAVVIHNGVGHEFLEGPAALSVSARRSLGLPATFVLSIGGATERKNLRLLADTWRGAHDRLPDHGLVVAGPHDDTRRALFADLPRVVLPGRLDEAVLPAVVASADAYVSTSTYEGFGLPLLEAMACRVPVVAVDRSATAEITGGTCLLAEPTAEAVARELEELLTRPTLRAELAHAGQQHARTFTWARSAASHLDCYAAAFAPRDRRPH